MVVATIIPKSFACRISIAKYLISVIPICPVLLSSISRRSPFKMSTVQLEKNAELAEDLITEIFSKLSDIEKASRNNVSNPELKRLREENEALRLEVAKWKELLIIREIKNGGNPIIRDPTNIGKKIIVKPQEKLKKTQSLVDTNLKKVDSSSMHGIKESRSISAVSKPPSAHGASSKSDTTTLSSLNRNLSANKPKDTATGAEEVIDVSKLDLRIGLITECIRHPDADALYIEKIDLGEAKPRTIISGLVKYVPIEKMSGRLVVILANLKPAKMRGILSEGMVMCASTPDKVEVLIPPQGSAPGDLVQIEGFSRTPDLVMNPKKKIFETVAPYLKTNDKKEATYKGKLWVVPGKGVITSESLSNVQIK